MEEHIKLGWKRDLILESDAVYVRQGRALNRRTLSGKVSRRQWAAHHACLVRSALRRAGLNRNESLRLVLA